MKYARKNSLIIEYSSLPEYIKSEIHEWCGFGNDCMVPLRSEFTPSGRSWRSDDLTQESLESYYRDQVETNGFKGDIDKFIEDYSLIVDKYLIDQKIDFEGVEQVLIDVCW